MAQRIHLSIRHRSSAKAETPLTSIICRAHLFHNVLHLQHVVWRVHQKIKIPQQIYQKNFHGTSPYQIEHLKQIHNIITCSTTCFLQKLYKKSKSGVLGLNSAAISYAVISEFWPSIVFTVRNPHHSCLYQQTVFTSLAVCRRTYSFNQSVPFCRQFWHVKVDICIPGCLVMPINAKKEMAKCMMGLHVLLRFSSSSSLTVRQQYF